MKVGDTANVGERTGLQGGQQQSRTEQRGKPAAAPGS